MICCDFPYHFVVVLDGTSRVARQNSSRMVYCQAFAPFARAHPGMIEVSFNRLYVRYLAS